MTCVLSLINYTQEEHLDVGTLWKGVKNQIYVVPWKKWIHFENSTEKWNKMLWSQIFDFILKKVKENKSFIYSF